MKFKLTILSLLALAACQQDVDLTEMNLTKGIRNGIVQGKTVDSGNPLARSVFSLISTFPEGTSADSGEMTELTAAGYICTASALAPRLAITASHCVENTNLKHRLEILDKNGNKIVNKVLKYKTHPEFLKNEDADIALLLMENEFPTDTLYPSLPTSEEYLDLRQLVASGYGRITGEKLRDGKAGTLRWDYVDAKGYNPESPIFKIDQTKGHGICSGDSGGPAYILDEAQTFKLVGIAYKVVFYSFPGDDNPDSCNNVGKYVNVQYHLNWLAETATELLNNN